MAAAVVVTGFKELDAKLRSLTPALQRKLVRQALRKSGKRDVRATKAIIRSEAHDTGALERAVKVRSLKRSRSRIGVGIFIDRDKYFADYASKHGGKPPNPAAGETAPFYVPAVIEFGDENKKPIRPLRRGLYGNADKTKQDFRDDLVQLIAENNTISK